MKKRFLFLINILLLISLIAGCQGGNDSETVQKTEGLRKVTVLLDWVPNTNHTGLYVAKDKGYYEAEGLDVEIIQPTEGGSKFIAAGQGDLESVKQVTYARAADTPLPIRAIAALPA